MKRISPLKAASVQQQKDFLRSQHGASGGGGTVTSSIWETLRDTTPNMKSEITTIGGHQTSPHHELSSAQLCATMCQKLHQRQLNRNRLVNQFEDDQIMIENLKPKCLIMFDYSGSRSRTKSKSHQHSAASSSSSPNSVSALPSISSSSSSITSNGGSQLQLNGQNDQAKKTCIESSRHILTHNGLVIKHPTLRLVPTIHYDIGQFNPIEGQTLPPLEFFLQLDSKNLAQNAQYFDLVLKVSDKFFSSLTTIGVNEFRFFFRNTNGLPLPRCCIQRSIRESSLARLRFPFNRRIIIIRMYNIWAMFTSGSYLTISK